ncbi:MAG: efflux RND transporter periplasmic adaptor subunit [Gallionellaceae bacterium]|nr:efflux RND transporter periplasmic adaptor subunit [Gallionellaceae bacterium]
MDYRAAIKHDALWWILPGIVFWLVALPVFSAETLAVAVVQYREVEQTWSTEGVVEATRQSTVSAQIAGRVKEINFDVGDSVKKGQVILRIDEREAAQALAGSQAQVMQAQAAMHNAQANYERARQLLAQGFISQAAMDKAEADYKVAQAQAAVSQAGESQAALAQGYTAVVAPYGGVVAARLVQVGEMVTVGKPLMTGFDPAQLRVMVSVPQYKLADIGAQPDVAIEIPSIKRRVQAAAVTVQPVADARTHTTQVRIDLPAKEAGVYPGMYVRAQFVVGKAKKLLVPVSAVLRRSEVIAVYVMDDKGGVTLRQIRLGETAGQDEIEVLAGLNAGEQVALDPIKAGMALAQQVKK